MASSDPNKDKSLADQLSGLDFGPAWAKEKPKNPRKEYSHHKGGGERRDDRRGKGRQGGGQGHPRGNKGRRDFKPRPQIEPTAGISCKVQPCKKAVEAIGIQIQKTGHTYPVYTLAKFVLGDRARYVLFFESAPDGPEMIRGKLEPALVLSRDEAIAQLWQGKLLEHFYDREEVEIEPPSGNFSSVAKCGFSGTLLGPPNHHSYQSTVARLHRERFPNMTLERYKSRIETVTDEESIEQWKAEASKVVRYRPKASADQAAAGPDKGGEQSDAAESPSTPGAPAEAAKPAETPTEAVENLPGDEAAEAEAKEPAPELLDESAVERHFAENHFDEAFESGRRFVIPGNIPASAVSPGLLEWLKRTSSDARKKTATLIPTLCSVLTGQRIAVFKWQGKLHTGPSRPHALPLDAKIADGPAKLMDSIGQTPGLILQDLVQQITGHPVDSAEDAAVDARKRLLSDLNWLLKEGYVMLLEGGQLYVPKKPIKDRPKEEQQAMLKSQKAQENASASKESPENPGAADEPAAPEKAADSGSDDSPTEPNP